MNTHALILLFALVLPIHAGDNALASVSKIYIGSMGQNDEAERFRILLDTELTKAGFTTVDAPEKADGVLTGALAVRVYADESVARVTVVLKTPDGKHLWDKDFEPHGHLGRIDTVKLRAQDVAKALRKEVGKGAKGK
jgi:hypothetical protein